MQTCLRGRLGALSALFVLIVAPTWGAVRDLHIDAPVSVRAGQEVGMSFTASTDAGQGEYVGFLQAEYSSDDGKTWIALCYLDNLGAMIKRGYTVKAGLAETTLRMRVRAAFRGGLAGDVDYSGSAIRWKDSWLNWEQPPTKVAVVTVK